MFASGAPGHPRAITMWDFSWLERRWAGAGYEDWDRVLEELVERGYDSVRIDAYPHLVAGGANTTWTLTPRWNQQAWGAQSRIDVAVFPSLPEFIRAARRAGIGVALSTWFREDTTDARMAPRRPADLGALWVTTLCALDDADVLDALVYVDLCNEFPMPPGAPYLYGHDNGEPLPVAGETVQQWMADAIGAVRAEYPELRYGFSFAEDIRTLQHADISSLDIADPHLWMAGTSDFYDRVGYNFERFDPAGYDNVVAHGKATYLAHQDTYDQNIFDQIDLAADWSRRTGVPLATTECWSIIDYKDWPGLEWDWVKDLNERALRHAAATGRWTALATSNFCGPQFHEMWRDIEYHHRLTHIIHTAHIDPDLEDLWT